MQDAELWESGGCERHPVCGIVGASNEAIATGCGANRFPERGSVMWIEYLSREGAAERGEKRMDVGLGLGMSVRGSDMRPVMRVRKFLSLTVGHFCHYGPAGVIAKRPNQPTTIMKTKLLIPALALPLFLAACDSKETATEKMNAGADKISEGVKEMADAAGKKVDAASDATKEKVDAAMDKAAATAEDAKADIGAIVDDAKAKAAAAADATADAAKKAADDAAKATEDAAKKVQDSVAPAGE